MGRVTEQREPAGAGREGERARDGPQFGGRVLDQVFGFGGGEQVADREVPVGEPAAQQGELGGRRLGPVGTGYRRRPVDPATGRRGPLAEHRVPEAVPVSERLATGGGVGGQLGGAVPGDDRAPRRAAGGGGGGRGRAARVSRWARSSARPSRRAAGRCAPAG